MRTHLLIRPAARGGKYLGPDAADAQHRSARVTLTNLRTGKTLEQFVDTLNKDAGPAGTDGNPNIMNPLRRCDPFVADAATVGVVFAVDIDEPTDFRVSVHGPLSFPDQARTAEADITLLPGVDVGLPVKTTDAVARPIPEGVVIEVPGLCISNVAADWNGSPVTCSAKVTMMCGCEIKQPADWYWPAADFNIQLVTYMESGAVYKYDLSFDTDPGVSSSFKGRWPNQAAPGDRVTSAWIFASEPKLGNQGRYRIRVEGY